MSYKDPLAPVPGFAKKKPSFPKQKAEAAPAPKPAAKKPAKKKAAKKKAAKK